MDNKDWNCAACTNLVASGKRFLGIRGDAERPLSRLRGPPLPARSAPPWISAYLHPPATQRHRGYLVISTSPAERVAESLYLHYPLLDGPEQLETLPGDWPLTSQKCI
jgi:hypothetical protein